MSEDAFVERQFDNNGQAVICRFFAPTLEPAGEYKCRWTIAWGEKTRQRHTCGIDGMQALLLAMRTVHTELIHSDAYAAGQLTYLEEADLGLPPAYTFPDDEAPN